MEASELGARLMEETIAESRCREEVGFDTFAEASREFKPSLPGPAVCIQ